MELDAPLPQDRIRAGDEANMKSILKFRKTRNAVFSQIAICSGGDINDATWDELEAL
jgi:hypothetical protein